MPKSVPSGLRSILNLIHRSVTSVARTLSGAVVGGLRSAVDLLPGGRDE